LPPRQAVPKRKVATKLKQLKIAFKVNAFAKAKVAPKAKGSSRGKRTPANKDDGTPQNLPEVQLSWQIADGSAWGWELRGGVRPNGMKFLRYRRPGETEFLEQKEAFVDLDPDVHAAVQAEKAEVLRRLDDLVPELQQTKSHCKSQTTTKQRSPTTTLPTASEQSVPVAKEGSHDPDAIMPGYVYVYKFPSGPAMEWTIRIKVVSNGTLVYSYKRPNATRWEYSMDGFKDSAVWQEIQSVREIQGKHIRSKLSMSSCGAAMSAAMKRKTPEMPVLPAASETKKRRRKTAQAAKNGAGALPQHLEPEPEPSATRLVNTERSPLPRTPSSEPATPPGTPPPGTPPQED
jgi:hypothetical protein